MSVVLDNKEIISQQDSLHTWFKNLNDLVAQ